MAMATSAVGVAAAAARHSWNPFYCGGTALPVNLLVMAKAVAIALLLTNHVRLLPDPFLPFVPGLDSIPPLLFQRTLQVVFISSALALLFNRWVRASAFLLGMTIIVSVVASKAYYGNNKTFCGFLLFLTSLYERGKDPWMIRLQLVLVYFGAGSNKLLDADWRSGVFFENWAVNRLHQPVYVALASHLPAMLLAKVVSWFTIATELGLSGVYLVRRLFPLGIWGSVLLHSGMLFFTGSTFTMFFYAMTASMLAFASWPKEPMLVLFDGDCGFCTRSKKFVERFDLEKMFRWKPFQSGAGRAYGISDADASRRLYLVNGDWIYSGFGAFKMMVLCNPISYLVTYIVLAAPGAGDSRFRNVVVAVLLVLFSPVFAPVGEAMYAVVARNRRLLSSNSHCRIE
jgi:predicted DCC family thiol-disulfide oxidoreductase YuxK